MTRSLARPRGRAGACIVAVAMAALGGWGAAAAEDPDGRSPPAAAPPVVRHDETLLAGGASSEAAGGAEKAEGPVQPPLDRSAVPKDPLPAGGAEPALPAEGVCAAARAAITAARKAGKLAAGVAAFSRLSAPESGCDAPLVFCAGQSLALAHVEAAYAAEEKGDAGKAAGLLVDGRRFGQPWPLLVGLGDVATSRAHARHDRKDWTAASLAYQGAALALNGPRLCEEEPPPPASAALEALFLKMGTALLLAGSGDLVRTKCDACALPFLGPVAGFTPRSQILPVTFEPKGSTLTPEGAKVVQALLGCLQARGATQVALAAYAKAGAKALAEARLEAIRRVFTDGGSKAELTTEATDAQPFKTDAGIKLSRAELDALNERVELKGVVPAGTADCK